MPRRDRHRKPTADRVTVRVQVQLTPAEAEAMRVAAVDDERSLSSWLRRAGVRALELVRRGAGRAGALVVLVSLLSALSPHAAAQMPGQPSRLALSGLKPCWDILVGFDIATLETDPVSVYACVAEHDLPWVDPEPRRPALTYYRVVPGVSDPADVTVMLVRRAAGVEMSW